ncbi:arginine--tRNA ligase [Candidatus Babeliales bacterium]|nr:arginine--tRNA ligase [Candidatus Babeliales bacterium]
MNSIAYLREHIVTVIGEALEMGAEQLKNVTVTLNTDGPDVFGDFSCNAAMILAKPLKTSPRQVAERIITTLKSAEIKGHQNPISAHIKDVTIAGPGFVNITLTPETWHTTAHELIAHPRHCFHLFPEGKKYNYLVEFVSANPTGPLHLAHGRNAIIGDTLSKVLTFLGHKVTREFYINDAGSQIKKLGESLKARCFQAAGKEYSLPEGGYQGDYLIETAKKCFNKYGKAIIEKSDSFFAKHAKQEMFELIKKDLEIYGISFDKWFSEETLHNNSSIEEIIKQLTSKNLAYEKDGATWFKATEYGDDKDRVLKKADGSYTYIAPDIAYHKTKFDRGFDKIIDILGQDHHGYVQRLKGTMKALGFDADKLEVILYQLVRMKKGKAFVKMSKRSGAFESLSDVIKTVGRDVARFFYLHRKADAHLEFDLDIALKKSDANPVYYILYAYVRTGSLLKKALDIKELKANVTSLMNGSLDEANEAPHIHDINIDEINLLKKICSLRSVLLTIANSYQTHLLSVYAYELAKQFHSYYNGHQIINEDDIPQSKCRLMLIVLVRNTLNLTLDLLGLSKPKKM